MDIIINSTSTVNGSTTALSQSIGFASSSPVDQLFYNVAALSWLLFLVGSAVVFFAIVYFFYKRFNRA